MPRLLMVVLMGAGLTGAPALAEPALSPAQSAVVAKSIATLKYPQERQMASGWSNAKKAAEMICRPIALEVLKGRLKGADRVFLGIDADPKTLRLVSDSRLEGQGQVRSDSGWRDFPFVCGLDPKTGTAVSFQATLPP